MQINEYRSNFNMYNLKAQNSTRVEKTFEGEIYKTSQASGTKKITEKEEMEILKKELYNEITDINKNPSSYQLSMSISISDGALDKMKSDPKFMNDVMKDLKKNAQSNPQMAFMPFDTHVTTIIKEDGVYSYIAHVYDDDSAETKEDKKTDAENKAKDALYYKQNVKKDVSTNKIDMDQLWLERKQQQEIFEMSRQQETLFRPVTPKIS